jgi:hypothetical protein
MSILESWFHRWNIPHSARVELLQSIGAYPLSFDRVLDGMSEGAVQSRIRLKSAQMGGLYLARNNSGAFKDDTGRTIRFGLANDSKAANKVLKSSDLIGVKRVTITPEMVGMMVGRFCSYEVKHEGWVYTGSEDEQAQRRWIELMLSYGAEAKFITGADQL